MTRERDPITGRFRKAAVPCTATEDVWIKHYPTGDVFTSLTSDPGWIPYPQSSSPTARTSQRRQIHPWLYVACGVAIGWLIAATALCLMNTSSRGCR